MAENKYTNPKKMVSDTGLSEYQDLAEQIDIEHNMSWQSQQGKIEESLKRLKLYNNQRKNKEDVGDTTLFTVMQTVLASLYDDRLTAAFTGREEGDDETAENFTYVAENDYEEMEKDQIDYEWDWDTCFFGRGLLEVEEWQRDADNNEFFALPSVIDPMSFLRDPFATSVNGDRKGRGAMRWGGYEVQMTEEDLNDNEWIFDDADLSKLSYGEGVRSLLKKAQEARDEAQGRDNIEKMRAESKLGANGVFDITVWYTHYQKKNEDGTNGPVVKVKVWLANERANVIGVKEIEEDTWPIVDRPLYPTAHDWDGTSIPDLCEDKQRARAIASNLGLKAMKADLYPMYVYDVNKVENKNELNFGYNKFIGVNAKKQSLDNAIRPMQKASQNLALVNFIYQTLDVSAQKATATPELQQGSISSQRRTLGELNIVSSSVDTRYSLAAKIWGWSEKRFWRRIYQMYKDNFAEDIDEKVFSLAGAFGAKWRSFTKKDLISRIDPNIIIESKAVNRAQQLEERQSLTTYFSLALQSPEANQRYGLKKLGKLYGMSKDELDRLYPPTVDERIAEDQNDMLNENKLPKVLPEDDHIVHLEIHSKAKDTPAARVHIETHKRALSIKKTNPELFPPDQPQVGLPGLPGQSGGQPQAGGQAVIPSGPSVQNSSIQPSQTSGLTA